MRAGFARGAAQAAQTKKRPEPLDAHAKRGVDPARALAATLMGAYAALLTRVYFERIGTICA